jgi:hypothetical protein
MRTDVLAVMLASNAGPADRWVPARRLALAMGAGTALAAVMMVLLMGVRIDIAIAVHTGRFWLKLGFAFAVAVASLVAVARLSRPGRRLSLVPAAMAAPFAPIWALAITALVTADAEQRLELLLGKTWAVCPFLISLLAAPIFVATILAVRGLAPTRLRLTGAAVGLLAGSTAAFVYSLHCPEMEAPFLATWYVLGMLIPTGIGAALGPRLLRW